MEKPQFKTFAQPTGIKRRKNIFPEYSFWLALRLSRVVSSSNAAAQKGEAQEFFFFRRVASFPCGLIQLWGIHHRVGFKIFFFFFEGADGTFCVCVCVWVVE